MNIRIKRINNYFRYNQTDKMIFHSKDEILVIEKKNGVTYTNTTKNNKINEISFAHYGTIPTSLSIENYDYDFEHKIPTIETVEEVIFPLMEFLKNYDVKYDIEYNEAILSHYNYLLPKQGTIEDRCMIQQKIIETEKHINYLKKDNFIPIWEMNI